MTTVLGEVLENATFYIDIPTNTHTIDPETGNPKPNTRPVEAHAYLKCDEQPPKQLADSQPTDTPLTWCRGWVTRLVDPQAPTVEFPPMMPESAASMLKVAIGGVKGRFYPIVQIPNAALQQFDLLGITGEAIWGWFDVGAN